MQSAALSVLTRYLALWHRYLLSGGSGFRPSATLLGGIGEMDVRPALVASESCGRANQLLSKGQISDLVLYDLRCRGSIVAFDIRDVCPHAGVRYASGIHAVALTPAEIGRASGRER